MHADLVGKKVGIGDGAYAPSLKPRLHDQSVTHEREQEREREQLYAHIWQY